jgi:alanine racemase
MHRSNPEAEIDLRALVDNFERIKESVPRAKILAMVKSNAYGHGSLPIVKTLDDRADAFGVACLGEAETLRKGGVLKSILLLKGFFSSEELLLADQLKCETLIHDFSQIEILEKTILQNPISVWLKIDTGMHRLGFFPEEVKDVYDRLFSNSKIKKPLKLISHFSDADDFSKNKTNQQIETFERITKNLPGEKSLANSGGIFKWSASHYDWVRPGITLYGASPFPEKIGKELGLIPVMTLKSKLIAIKQLPKGEAIGYGSTFITPEIMKIGIINIGYGDGYPRHVNAQAGVLINGVFCPIIGRVAMDMITIDLRPVPNAKLYDPVILWGKDLPAEKIALSAETTVHELFCKLTNRVGFVYS